MPLPFHFRVCIEIRDVEKRGSKFQWAIISQKTKWTSNNENSFWTDFLHRFFILVSSLNAQFENRVVQKKWGPQQNSDVVQKLKDIAQTETFLEAWCSSKYLILSTIIFLYSMRLMLMWIALTMLEIICINRLTLSFSVDMVSIWNFSLLCPYLENVLDIFSHSWLNFLIKHFQQNHPQNFKPNL